MALNPICVPMTLKFIPLIPTFLLDSSPESLITYWTSLTGSLIRHFQINMPPAPGNGIFLLSPPASPHLGQPACSQLFQQKREHCPITFLLPTQRPLHRECLATPLRNVSYSAHLHCCDSGSGSQPPHLTSAKPPASSDPGLPFQLHVMPLPRIAHHAVAACTFFFIVSHVPSERSLRVLSLCMLFLLLTPFSSQLPTSCGLSLLYP